MMATPEAHVEKDFDTNEINVAKHFDGEPEMAWDARTKVDLKSAGV